MSKQNIIRAWKDVEYRWISNTNGILAPPFKSPPKTLLRYPRVARRQPLPARSDGDVPSTPRLLAKAAPSAALRGLDRRLRMEYGRASRVYQGRKPRSDPLGKAGGGCLTVAPSLAVQRLSSYRFMADRKS
jgi:hypothetical protein